MMNKYAEHKLKCLLQNSKNYITVSVLQKEYCDTFGHEFPYKELGFFSMLEYLRNLPEVSCTWCEKSDCYFVTYNPQKMASKHRPEPKAVISLRGGRSYHDAGPQRKTYVFLNKYNTANAIRSHLIDLVKDCKDGITIPELSLLYEEKTGAKLNLYDHGFNTIYDFIDTVDELLIKTKNDIDRVHWTQMPHRLKYCARSASGKHRRQNIVGSQESLEGTDSLNDTQDCLSEFASSDILDSPPTEKLKKSEKEKSAAENRVSDTVKAVFKAILKKHPEGIWASQFCHKYKELTGCYFEMQNFGYYNFISLIEDLPSVFAWKEQIFGNGDFRLFDVETFKESKGKASQGDTFDKLSLEKKLKAVIFDIRDLLSFHEDGIYLNDFLRVYKLNFGRVFNLEEFGWKSLKTFLDSIADEVPLCMVSSAKKTKVYSHHSKELCCLPDSMKFSVPSDVADVETKLKSQWIPAGVNLKDLMCVYISSLTNPHDLYIQFDDGNVAGVLVQLMDDMLVFYNSDESDLYKMNSMHVKTGALCVGISYEDSKWHRMEIKDVNVDCVEAYLVDFGSTEIIRRKDLRYLRKKYLDLPSQAVAARLANIKLRHDVHWNNNMREMLLDLCSGKRMEAFIYGYKTAEQLLYLYIWDDSNSSKLYSLNEVLVCDGLAGYCDDATDDSITVNPSWSLQKCQVYCAAGRNPECAIPAMTDLRAALSDLTIDANSKCQVKNKSLLADGVASSVSCVYENGNCHLPSHIHQMPKKTVEFSSQVVSLQVPLNTLNQSSTYKRPTDVDFSNHLLFQSHRNPGTNVDNVAQSRDFRHSVLNILSQHNCHNSVNSLNQCCTVNMHTSMVPHSETKAVNQNIPQNIISSVDSDFCVLNNFPSLCTPLKAAEQFYTVDINKSCKSATLSPCLSDFSCSNGINEVPPFIPPPQPAHQLHCVEPPANILPPHHTTPVLKPSSLSLASAFSTTSFSHSLNSLSSSEEKYSACRAPSSSSSNCDQGFCSQSISPTSCESVHFPFKSAARRNEPDVYNELHEYPLENLCKEIMSKSVKNVKRLFLRGHVIVHLINLIGRPHISCHDLAWITIGCGNASQLQEKTKQKHINRHPITIYKTDNEVLFEEIEKNDIKEITHKLIDAEWVPVLAVFPLKLAIEYIYAFAPYPDEIIGDIEFQIIQPDFANRKVW